MTDESPVDGALNTEPDPGPEPLPLPKLGYLVVDLRETCWSQDEVIALAKTMDGYEEGHIHCIAMDIDMGSFSPPAKLDKPGLDDAKEGE